MFPTRLSILSPEKRAHLKHLLYLQFFKNGLEILLIGLTISGIVILSGWWVLQSHFNDLVTSINFITNRDTKRNAEIKDINALVGRIDSIQREYILWTPVIYSIVEKIPPQIKLTSLKLDRSNNTYILSGVAPTRNDLLLFRDEFSKLPQIKTVDIPLSQLTARTNISFTLTATVSTTSTRP